MACKTRLAYILPEDSTNSVLLTPSVEWNSCGHACQQTFQCFLIATSRAAAPADPNLTMVLHEAVAPAETINASTAFCWKSKRSARVVKVSSSRRPTCWVLQRASCRDIDSVIDLLPSTQLCRHSAAQSIEARMPSHQKQNAA